MEIKSLTDYQIQQLDALAVNVIEASQVGDPHRDEAIALAYAYIEKRFTNTVTEKES